VYDGKSEPTVPIESNQLRPTELVTSSSAFATTAPSGSSALSHCAPGEFCLMESPPEYPISERPVDVGWVGGWASDFDILLSDPIGIKAFTVGIPKEKQN